MLDFTILSPSEQVAEHLCGELLRGRWSGTMPGVPTLAAELGVDHKTVASAIGMLEESGMLIGQGAGRPRRIQLPESYAPPSLRVALLSFDAASRGELFMVDLQHLLQEAGHLPFFPKKNLLELDMDPRRVARMVLRTEADAWVVVSAAREVLEWFAEHETPAFALAGRHGGLPLAATRPDKSSTVAEVTRCLIALGHRRISFLCRRHLRLPQPARSMRAYLGALDAAGIATGLFHMPDWEESCEGLRCILESLFGQTPPTALILDEAYLYHAAYHHLTRRGLRVPEDVSLVCTDGDPTFVWCRPSVAHIAWDHRPVARRVVRWANNVARGKDDRRQTYTKAGFVEGGSVGVAPSDRDRDGPGSNWCGRGGGGGRGRLR